jgi:hypothetical protein
VLVVLGCVVLCWLCCVVLVVYFYLPFLFFSVFFIKAS